MMKKLLYIFMCLAMTQACIKENFPTSPNDVTEGEEVTLSMSVSVPGMEVATRALGEYDYGKNDKPHPTLWVVVFDQQGYFVQAAKATSQEFEEEDGYPYNTNFEVKLTTSPEQRILHFLLNYSNAETLDLPSGHESTVIGTLTADSDNQDVYWQRVVLPYGIVPPMKDNEINTDYTNYVKPYVTKVPLIRNFAKVTVTESLDNFTIEGFSVMNRPNRGTVAPYADGRFVNYLQKVPENGTLYNVLTNEIGYHGTTPESDAFGYDKTTLTDSDFVSGENAAIYLYESTYKGVVEETPTVIIKGTYEGVTAYYKADLVVQSIVPGQEKYADILRNFEYNLIITSVAGPGKTLDEAVKGAANNNLSGSVQIQELTNITNGEDGLYVSATDITVVEKKDLVIRYKFVKDITGENPTVSNGDVSIFVEDGEVIAKKADGTYDVTCASDNSSDEWREVTVKLNNIPSTKKTQKIIFYDKRENGSKLRREVIINYRPKLVMTVACDPTNVAKITGSLMTVNISLPDGLTSKAMFPLDFAIESNTSATSTTVKQYLSPAKFEDMSVRTAKSIVANHTKESSYQYIKSLSFDEYHNLPLINGKRVMPVFFVTNTEESASTVYIQNPYFENAEASFGNLEKSPTKVFTDLAFEGIQPGVGREVAFKFNMTDNTPVTLTLIGVEPIDDKLLVPSGGNKYTYSEAHSGENELRLKTINRTGAITVVLNAENYQTAVKTEEQDEYKFSELGFSGAGLQQLGKDKSINFTFKAETADENVTVTLEGLKPAVETKALTLENGKYIFTTSKTPGEVQTIELLTTDEEGVISVSLDAYNAGYANNSYSFERKLQMSATLEGEQYYGVGKTVTLNLTTNKAGTYTVTFKEGDATTNKTITVEDGQTTGTATYTTTTFNGAISASVAYEDGTEIDVNGDKRNLLYIAPTNVTATEGEYSTDDIKMSSTRIASNNWDRGNGAIATFSIDDLSDGVTIEIENLEDTTQYYLVYRYRDSRYSNTSTYMGVRMSAEDLANGTAMNFGKNY